MSVWIDVARLATVVNVLLLASLGYVWGRNYLAVRSKHTLGLLLFSTFLLAENALTLYYYVVDPDLSFWYSTQMPTVVWRVTMLLHVLQAVGLGFLAWVTWD
ncbi:hypothetical protein [Haloplanus halophilus]|uniref:hypothetical protein n=1 Tax=Haloplanus halophilus TaxID=2949993 RepID=UPI002041B5DC|nr:hypothetical protein [Haloplanus sp. GDY1]